MKAIISHDIDHISILEHSRDLVLPKFILRSNIELVCGKISLSEYACRFHDILKNRWQNIQELIAFNRSMGLTNSFFIGVNKGLGLSYSLELAAVWGERILNQGLDLGLHGITFDSLAGIRREHALFEAVFGEKTFGVRMHYIRKNIHTFHYLQEAGFSFDSTEHSFRNPYRIGGMWEFPFQIMDGWMIEGKGRWQTHTLEQAKNQTIRTIEMADRKGISHLGIIFHDRYFSKSFDTWRNWYVWLVEYLQANQIQILNFRQAIEVLHREESQVSGRIRIAG